MTPGPLHASCVAVDGRGLLIRGASGAGKSALALRMIALGALLVADDRTLIAPRGADLWATCPPALHGLIEARGLGLLRAPTLEAARIALIVDLDTPEPDRLPPRRSVTVMGVTCDLVLGSRSDHFPSALWCYLQYGRAA